MLINKKDLAFAKTLKKFVDDAGFEVKGEAVATVAACLHWLGELEKRFEDDLHTEPPKEVKEPIKAIE